MRKGAPPPSTRRGRQRRTAGKAQGRQVDDPYVVQHKPAEPSACRECGAVYHEGRWHWDPPPAGAAEATCPACHRIIDDYPAGIVTLHGDLLRQHRAEVVNLIRHQEELEKGEHPLNRIMAIEETDADTLTVTTTDIHLPRRIGEAIKRAYHGELALSYDQDGYFIRVDWSRPD